MLFTKNSMIQSIFFICVNRRHQHYPPDNWDSTSLLDWHIHTIGRWIELEAVYLHVFFSVYFLLTQLSLLRYWTDSFPHRHQFSFYFKIIYTEVFNREMSGFGTLHGKICHLGLLGFWANDDERTISVGRKSLMCAITSPGVGDETILDTWHLDEYKQA